jgi:hypothetical protein
MPGHVTNAACVLTAPPCAVQGVEKAMEVLRLLLSATAHKQCQQALLLFQGYSGCGFDVLYPSSRTSAALDVSPRSFHTFAARPTVQPSLSGRSGQPSMLAAEVHSRECAGP